MNAHLFCWSRRAVAGLSPAPAWTGRFPPFLFVLLFFGASSLVSATNTVTRSYPLRAGWNALYLEVTPAQDAIGTALAGLPVESVWRHQTRLTAADFLQDTNEPVWNRDEWLVYVPTHRIESLANTLFRWQGGHAYLLKLSADATLTVTGVPFFGRLPWKPQAYNLRGLPVDGGAPPTFRDFFKFSPAHYSASRGALQPILRLTSTGQWQSVAANDLVEAGAAYWIFTEGASDYFAPLNVATDDREGLRYGTGLTELPLRLANLSGSPVSVTLRELDRPDPPRLVFAQEDPTNGRQWATLPVMQVETLAPLEARRVWLGLQRQHLTASTYHSLIEVRDNAGTLVLVPVEAAPLRSEANPSRSALHAPQSSPRLSQPGVPSRFAGLWAGAATLTEVSEVHSGTLKTNRLGSSLVDSAGGNEPLEVVREQVDPTPKPVGASFDLRVLLHVDSEGNVRLLKEVIQLWRDGTYATNGLGQRTVASPGTYVLLTDRTRLGEFQAAGLRDSRPVGRRLSTVHFDFPAPATNNFLLLEGVFGTNTTLRGTFTVLADHPTNPFKHKYHPDHDNLDPTYRQFVAEAFEINREFTFEFAPSPVDGRPTPGYGYDELSGTYQEGITGLHRETIHTRGTFRVQRISPQAELNPL